MFLTVYTPTYRRPNLLAMCRASVLAQTSPVEHVIIHDRQGLGVDGMFADIPNHTDKVHGAYVMVLSDDNVLTDPDFAADLERVTCANGKPDVVMFKGEIQGTVQPAAWGGEPIETMVDLSCYAVKTEVWKQHSRDWGHRYEGDFDFIHRLWERGYRFLWWDKMVFRAQQISRGLPEAA